MNTNKTWVHSLFTTLSALALMTGCDAAPAFDDAGDIALRNGGSGNGGPNFNTGTLEGAAIAEVGTVGQTIEGVRMDAVYIKVGVGLKRLDDDSVYVSEGKIHGELDGVLKAGFDFDDSVWVFNVNGSKAIMRLTDVQTSATAGLYDPLNPYAIISLNPDRLVYRFEYGSVTNPIPTCETDADGGEWMVLFDELSVDTENGDFSLKPDQFYMGCLSGSVGKSTLWGYGFDGPGDWLTIDDGNMASRMVMADYCGDATPFTNVGNEVLIEDQWNINWHGLPAWDTEALWTSEGAECVNLERATGMPFLGGLVCSDGNTIPLCGSELDAQDLWASGNYAAWTKI